MIIEVATESDYFYTSESWLAEPCDRSFGSDVSQADKGLSGGDAMKGDSLRYELDISEHLFLLTTESLRLRSNEVKRYQTLANLIDDTIGIDSPFDDHSTETILEHLAAIPTNGNIRIDLRITKTSADSFGEVKQRLSEKLGSNISVGDALSVLLFHYVVRQKATRILKRLGLDSVEESARPAECDQAAVENVFPIR
ncbi:hypothetical protein ACQKE8_23620 [Sphingobium limneticum]|uniref:hypothetical protein n=1 Tax=Sphingobium limneticum TaxID=1007511 RepID=UPI003D023B2C